MAIKIFLKVGISGTRKLLFQRLVKKRAITNAALLREIIDFYFENNPEIK
jgi:hypothetical protein